MQNRSYYIYILTNYTNTTFYIGVTNDIIRRVYEHKNKSADGFTSKYNLNKLVYFEETDDIESALRREKQLKNWRRIWKVNLIKSNNPDFEDLYCKLLDPETSSG